MRGIVQQCTFGVLVLAAAITLLLVPAAPSTTRVAPTEASDQGDSTENNLRVEGEQRFRANCGRCHMPPHKFPPRMMATIVLHMRVRATITDDDMRLILLYMTQ